MNKAEKLAELNKQLEKYNKLQADIKIIESQIEPTFLELRNAFDKNDNPHILTHNTKHKKYEFVLGGDGRSMPWSEFRMGNVLEITISPNIYISDMLKNKLKDYVRLTSENGFDKIEIIEK